MLVDGVSKGGNLLFNVGPTGRGTFDPVSAADPGRARRVDDAARALDLRRRAERRHVPPPDCRYTQRGDRLYLHLFALAVRARAPARAWPARSAYAQLLNDASEIAFASQRSRRPGPATPRWVGSRRARLTLDAARSGSPTSPCRSSSCSSSSDHRQTRCRDPAGLGRLGLGDSRPRQPLPRDRPTSEARAVVDAAWEGGVRYFDTAPHYGLGLSERRLGAALRRLPARRSILLSTKVGRLLRADTGAGRPGSTTRASSCRPRTERVWDPSPAGVRRSLSESLERIGHGLGSTSPTCTTRTSTTSTAASRRACRRWREAKEAGLVRAIGIGSKSVARAGAAVRTGLCDLIMVAGRLTILDDSGAELVELCRSTASASSTSACSTPARWPPDVPDPDLHFEYAPITRDAAGRSWSGCTRCAPEFGVSVADAALQYSWQIPEIVNVTVGASIAEPDRAVADRHVRADRSGALAGPGGRPWLSRCRSRR